MSEYGTLSKTDKADFLKCLCEIQVPSYDGGGITTKAYVADGAVIINMNPPKLSKTYGEYTNIEFIRSLNRIICNASRFDCVFDVKGKPWKRHENFCEK